jgi:hypothetical protein
MKEIYWFVSKEETSMGLVTHFYIQDIAGLCLNSTYNICVRCSHRSASVLLPEQLGVYNPLTTVTFALEQGLYYIA